MGSLKFMVLVALVVVASIFSEAEGFFLIQYHFTSKILQSITDERNFF